MKGFALRCWLCSASADVVMRRVYGALLVAMLVVCCVCMKGAGLAGMVRTITRSGAHANAAEHWWVQGGTCRHIAQARSRTAANDGKGSYGKGAFPMGRIRFDE